LQAGQRLIAYWVERRGAGEGEPLRRWLEQRLPEHMRPVQYVQLPALPRTATGKIDRHRLPLPEPEAAPSHQPPRTPVEELIAGLWTDLLKRQTRPGIHDNFFELGGHSLLATKFMSRLRAALQIEDIPLVMLFESPTIAGLAANLEETLALAGTGTATPREIVRIRAGASDSTPLYFIHALDGDVACYCDIARDISSRLTIFGVKAPVFVAENDICSLETIAARYLAAIEQHSSGAPYQLGGWSLGAVIALEIARQASQRGRDPQQLILLDPTQPPKGNIDFDERIVLDAFLNDVKRQHNLDLTVESQAIQASGGSLTEILEHATYPGASISPADLVLLEFALRVRCFQLRAALAYRPAIYDSRAILFHPARRNPDYWLQYLGPHVQTFEVGEDHFSMMRGANAGAIAKEINKHEVAAT
jgi:thioesterase domain-containing protein